MYKFKGDRPGVKWSYMKDNKTLGRYDIILNKFENEEGGLKDLQFE